MTKKNKIAILIIAITIALMSSLLVGYDLDQKKQLKVIKLDKNTDLIENKEKIQYNIDSINSSDSLINIKGWAILKGVNSYNIMPAVILKDENGNLYKLKTRIVQRKDITLKFNGEYTDVNTHLTCVTKSGLGVTRNKYVYDNCGITSQFRTSDLSNNQTYKIGIQLQINNISYFIWTSSELKL